MIDQIERTVGAFEEGRITRRQLVARLLALSAGCGAGGVLALAGRPAAAQDEAATFEAAGLDHIALSVTDLGRSRDFYRRHLGLRVTSEGPSSVFMSCGDDFLALFRAARPAMHHYCYAIRGYDPDDAVERLRAAGLEPHRRMDRVYFDDPDGLEVQVASGNERASRRS